MSRWDAPSDLDYRDEFWNRHQTVECAKCGTEFVVDPADTGRLCDHCCAMRDAEESARIAMSLARGFAKAQLSVIKKKDAGAA